MSTQATLSAVPFASSVCTGQELAMQVTVSTNEGAINAAQGTLHYDPAMLRITSISTGRSVFKFWPVTPAVDEEQGAITFAGGLPTPGYKGESGLLFTVHVVPKKSANNQELFTWDRSSLVLLNDGLGTPADLSLSAVRVNVYDPLPGHCEEIIAKPTIAADTVAPEPFEVVITKTDQGFQGQYFASFYAYDADSGIARYEIRENSEAWHIEQSPYRLRLQEGRVLLEVKAIDASGNERISSASLFLTDGQAMHLGPWWFWLIIACAIAAALWRAIVSRRKDTDTQSSDASGEAATPMKADSSAMDTENSTQ
jgi:hypothetical protein